MTIDMNDTTITSITQLQACINAAKAVGCINLKRKDDTNSVYDWMNTLLIRLQYRHLGKKDKGLVREYLILFGGYTATHIDHLISQYKKVGKISRKERTQPSFESIYTACDIVLLAKVFTAYSHQNGNSILGVCKDMYHIFNDMRFERLANISVSHIYNLKKTEVFTSHTGIYTKTCPTTIPIGERKKPYPEGKPGYIRVDSVHQGDLDKQKGVYHVNLVDEVTQWEVIICVEGISEKFLLPALEIALSLFPFHIINFHSDNGSEYINYQVSEMLTDMLIKQTKSRARQSGDNGLVECKNGAVIRKYMGHTHIPRQYAGRIMDFYLTYFIDFVNYHRYSAFPEEVISSKGKIVKKYKTVLTPCMKLCSLPHGEDYLREGITIETLTNEAKKKTHLFAAEEMSKERTKLFTSFKN